MGNMPMDDPQPISTRLKVVGAVALLTLIVAFSAYVTGWRKLPQCCGLVGFVSLYTSYTMSLWHASAEPVTRREQFWYTAIEYAAAPFLLVFIAGFFGLIK
jgi:hypothetical protein